MQAIYIGIALSALLVAIIAQLAEWRRNRRRDLDRPGFMPWVAIAVFAMMVAIVTAAMALHG